jgi:hypothetical protein
VKIRKTAITATAISRMISQSSMQYVPSVGSWTSESYQPPYPMPVVGGEGLEPPTSSV